MSDTNAADITLKGARLSKVVLKLPLTLFRGVLLIPTALVNLMEKHGVEK